MKRANPYSAYQKATHTVSKTRQVVMLYEGVLRNLQQARKAMEEKDISERYNKLVKASEIVIGLQMSLDFDSGESSAQALYDFYSSIDTRIMQLHRSQSLELCDALIDEVRGMHEVWCKIDRGEIDATQNANAAPSAPAQQQLPPANNSAQTHDAPAAAPASSPPQADSAAPSNPLADGVTFSA